MTLDTIIKADQQLLLALNGSDSLYLDNLMMTITSTWTWIPAAVALIYVLFKNNDSRNFVVLMLMLVLTIALADGFSSGFCKPFFARWRPTNDPSLMFLVDTVDGYRGGKYGFISSHAANTFSVFIFSVLLIRSNLFASLACIWSLANCYSRIYLGVHYPLDIFFGLLWGAVVGTGVYVLYAYLSNRFMPVDKSNLVSDQYTSSGYSFVDVNGCSLVLSLCFLYAIIVATVC